MPEKLVYRSMRFLSVMALALVGACGLHAQTAETPQDKTATLSVAAKLVNVPVIVRDKKGALIQTLVKDDFSLMVDGKAQTIRYFDQDKNIPLILGLMVDTSMSQRSVLDSERTASGTFLEQMLAGPQDKAFVIQFARQTDLLQDLTNSKPKLQAALKQIDSSNANSSGGDPDDNNGSNNGSGGNQGQQQGRRGGRGGGGGMRGGGTTLYDALFLASDEITGKQKGRKALIILSDGADRGSKESLTKSLEAAQRADTIVYAIYFKGEDHGGGGGNRGFGFPGGRGGGFPGGGGRGGGGGYPGGGGRGGGEREVDGKKILQRMADETGGRLFEITKKQTVEQIYTQIGEELRAQYRLGFTPDKETASEGYHQIVLAVKDAEKKKLVVQTRDGYYTGD